VLSRENLYRSFAYLPVSQSGYSAFSVVEALARERGLHRVPIIDSKRQVINLVTQSQVVRYLADHVEMIGSIAQKTIKECPRLFKEVLSVREETIAIDAFNLMVEKNVQGIAICNEEGRLRGNIRSDGQEGAKQNTE
jgi:CBS-domain-containing membrane protein